MVRNKEWSALSLKDRADFYKIAVENGYTNKKDIINLYNSFKDGGNTGSSKGYVTTQKEDLKDLETFNSNWYKYRDSQLANTIKADPAPQHVTRGLNFWQNSFPGFVKDTKLAEGARNYINERLKYLKEFAVEEAIKDKQAKQILIDTYYDYFPNERKENEVEIGPPQYPNDYSLTRLFELTHKGGYAGPEHTIIYSDGHENTSTKIHERTHASVPQHTLGYHPILRPIRNVVLKQGVNAHNYYDKLTEVYARLMQLRYDNNLDPSHTYTKEEINAMRNDPDFKDYHIFDRYTDESILMLLNEVAQNTTDPNRLDYVNPDNIAAFGGKINKFAPGGPIREMTASEAAALNKTLNNSQYMLAVGDSPDAPAYLSTDVLEPAVVKAFDSNEDYNRYYGEQFGKRVAKERDRFASKIKEGLEYVPGLGDAMDAANLTGAISNKDYLQAGIIAGGALIPNFLEKPFKWVLKGLKNNKSTKKSILQALNAIQENTTPLIEGPKQDLFLTHGIYLEDLKKNLKEFGAAQPNPSLQLHRKDVVDFPWTGNIEFISKPDILHNSFMYNGDGITSTVTPILKDGSLPIEEVSKRMYDKDFNGIGIDGEISREEMIRLRNADKTRMMEVKSQIPVDISTQYGHIVLPEDVYTQEAREILEPLGIPITTYSNGERVKTIQSILENTPELTFKKQYGGNLFTKKNKYLTGGGIINSYIDPSTVGGAVAKGVVQLFDPTGISSYPDVYAAGKEFFQDPTWANAGRLAFETVGALPLIGKVTAPFKAAKTAKLVNKVGDVYKLSKLADNAESVNKVIDTLPELIPLTRKAAEATQNFTTKHVVDPLFDLLASKNKYYRVAEWMASNDVINIINASNNIADVTSTIESTIKTAKK